MKKILIFIVFLLFLALFTGAVKDPIVGVVPVTNSWGSVYCTYAGFHQPEEYHLVISVEHPEGVWEENTSDWAVTYGQIRQGLFGISSSTPASTSYHPRANCCVIGDQSIYSCRDSFGGWLWK